jgi:hypothetical protein
VTTREMLRAVAAELEATAALGGVETKLRAAAIRAFLARWDHEERWARDIEAASLNAPQTKHAAIVVQGVLARLDLADTPSRSGEPG